MNVIDISTFRARSGESFGSSSGGECKLVSFEAIAIANAFIELAMQDVFAMTHLRLQKVVYMAHAWHLFKHGAPLIDEQPRAWPLGPVIESIYAVVRQKGHGQLVAGEPLVSFFDAGVVPMLPPKHVDANVRESAQEAIITVTEIWRTTMDWSDEQLSSHLSQPSSAWAAALKMRLMVVPALYMAEEASGWHQRSLSRSN